MKLQSKHFIVSICLLSAICCGQAPKVIKMIPENGATNLKPGPCKIRFLFDQDMKQHGQSICGGGENYPDFIGDPKWTGSRSMVLMARLKPNHQYNFSLNCDASGKYFKSVHGESAETLFVTFSTTDKAKSSISEQKKVSLDAATKESLKTFDEFFHKLFKFSTAYKNAAKDQKESMENKWIQDLQSGNNDTATAAAAHLGMVRCQSAAKPIEKAMGNSRRGGRFRWVCTRSLGEIGSKSSIPVLISLVDNQNSNTRVYARVSLWKMTGIYFGDDKEKWQAWYKDPDSVTCTEDVCLILDGEKTSSQGTGSSAKINYTLRDTYGRIVESDDYLGSPTLYIIGACWCGGCQQDMAPFRDFVNKNRSLGLQGVRVVALDNELASLDFQKHYRLNCVQLLDTNRKFEYSLNNRRGWTFLVLVDAQGKPVYKANSPKEDDYKAIYKRLKSAPVAAEVKTTLQNGIPYMPATIERNTKQADVRNERFASIAADTHGNIYTVFTVSDDNSSDVFMRYYDGAKQSEDIPISSTDADEYDATVLVDNNGKVWISWCSNAKGGRYNIFIAQLDHSQRPLIPYQLTKSDDDAMHPRMACDKQGNLWVTYYKWKKRNGRSRDKEVYIQKLSRDRWTEEIQVSPTDVPWYEDHTEPAIASYKDGVMVAWSWDFHPPIQGYSKYATTPTIFMRPIDSQMKPGKIISASEKKIDVTPAIFTSNNHVLCTWDSAGRNKNLSLAYVDPNKDTAPKSIQKQPDVSNVCSPCIAGSKDGRVSVVWSENGNGNHWVLKHAYYHLDSQRWTSGDVIVNKGNPRFPSAAYDSAGKLWIAWSSETQNGSRIACKSFTEDKLSKY
jgi:peroxiredoxin